MLLDLGAGLALLASLIIVSTPRPRLPDGRTADDPPGITSAELVSKQIWRA